MENSDSYIPSHMENSSPGEKFAYKAELQKNFIENDTISSADQFNAETEAMINGPKLDLNPSLTEADLMDSSPIKQAYLTGNYIEDGNLDHSDVFEADMQSSLNGSSSSIETNNYFSPGEELVRDSELTESFLENGEVTSLDEINAENTAFVEGSNLDYLF